MSSYRPYRWQRSMSSVLEIPTLSDLNARLRYGGPKVMWPRTRSSLPQYSIEFSRLRPVWRGAPEGLLKLILDPVMFWCTFGTYEGEPIKFDRWQVAWLRNRNRFRAVEKAPQIGFSWLSAMEALHECLLFTDATAGFVSVDMREATEKILYARKAYHELPQNVKSWVPLIRDAVDQLDFGDEARRSRLMSLPATAGVRGRRMSVYLDEIDFYRDGGRDVFRAAMGRVARGGRVTMGSTAFGVDTQLDRTMQGQCQECSRREEDHEGLDHPYLRVFSRARLPWVVVQDEDMLKSIHMSLAELDAEDAAEEYECLRGGSTSDTFPAVLLMRQTHDYEAQDPILWEPSGPAVAGFDVGKSRHPSILSILERGNDRIWRQSVLHQPRKGSLVDGEPLTLPEQHTFLRELMRRWKTMKLVVDVGGIGAHIGQALQTEFGDRVIAMHVGSRPENLPKQDKIEMVTEIKRALEASELQLVQDREQAMQFRRTRKLPNGTVDQPGTSRRTHYDRFWATVYAWYGATAGRGLESAYSHKQLFVISTGRG